MEQETVERERQRGRGGKKRKRGEEEGEKAVKAILQSTGVVRLS